MPKAFDPSRILPPSKERSRAIESTLMFRRRTIWIVYIGANAIAVGLVFWGLVNRSTLVTPVAPNFRASMIGVGVFLGVLAAAVEREAWLLGFGGRRAPKGLFVAVAMAALVVASGFGGDFIARKLWEWQAFHGLRPVRVDHRFMIIARSSGRSGDALELRDISTGQEFWVTCSNRMLGATRTGDRMIVPVETGRGGAQRVTLPTLGDLRRI